MLIAEIGNNHFGDFERAKLMIHAANNSGADLIKMQAIKSSEIFGGSMPGRFYDQCEFSVEQYLDLIDYARGIGNDLFFSIFSTDPRFDAIRAKQNWVKVAAKQPKKDVLDQENTIVSVPVAGDCPKFKRAEVLHVSDYLTTAPNLWHIQTLTDHLGRQAGYSDHCIGIDTCIAARETFGAIIIEKHFTLEKNVSIHGQIFRDTVHGATPNEFAKLARELSK